MTPSFTWPTKSVFKSNSSSRDVTGNTKNSSSRQKATTGNLPPPPETPAAAKIPEQLEGKPDREDWGTALGDFLTDLYQCSSDEAEKIHHLAWHIQNRAARTNYPPLQCHPNDIPDILKTMPNFRAAGKDGIPSQILKDLPFHHITKIAALFQQLANDVNYRSTHRPLVWEEAIVTMLPKEAGATSLTNIVPLA